MYELFLLQYFARHLLPVYRSWHNSTIVTLICGARSWEVAVQRKKKVCRFGKGWNQFTHTKELKVGQKLKFTYVKEYTFSVDVVG